MLELYIFNKESPAKDGLSYWQHNQVPRISNTLNFNLDRFKFKDNSQHLFSELARELTYHYKETEELKQYFNGLSSMQITVELADDYHHLLSYNKASNTLTIDSKIQNRFIPIYLFAVYYALQRHNRNENQVYQKLFDFLLAFDFRSLKAIIDFLKADKSSNRTFDAGGYLLGYLEKIYAIKTEGLELNNKERLLETQLLRNRALCGKSPYDLNEFEKILERYADDPFSGEANQELFDSLNSNFDKDFAIRYFKHLSFSLEQIGLSLVAQRGSRVAHEQGPILINSGALEIDEDFSVQVRKLKSSQIENSSKLEELCNKLKTRDISQLKKTILNIYVNLDTLTYLSESKNFAKARFEKSIIELRELNKEIISELERTLEEKASVDKDIKEKFMSHYDNIKTLEKNLLTSILEIEELLDESPSLTKKAVIYVQRPSSRSGHFIPRLLLGKNLYIETDEESEEQRINAIPFNFVSPEFDYIAAGIDSFFENASISIVTDRDSGQPNIKWENAEDLAISLAPGMYQAIKSSQERGRKFHYQLETTLFGPLIELFLSILENEMSVIASIDYHNLRKNPNIDLNSFALETGNTEFKLNNEEINKIIDSKKAEIIEAADFVFNYYLLEDELLDYMMRESLNKEDSVMEMILNLRDVQEDIAAYCLLKNKDHKKLEEIKSEQKSLKDSATMSFKDIANKISKDLKSSFSRLEIKDFIKKYIRYLESTVRKDFLNNKADIQKIILTANKNITDADYYYNFSVAPSRIDFGKHVVASVTSLMGRMLGADDPESLKFAKEYIDYVSKTSNSFFESSAEAGSVKVIENTCRALQYSKAISFQGVFQSFGIDGMLARKTVNSRNTSAAGIHIMENGTMASTGYCITKEPLFILLGLALNSETILDQLGVEEESSRQQLKELFKDFISSRDNFISDIDWQLHIYEEMINSPAVQKYISDPNCRWLPSLKSMVHLLKYATDICDESTIAAKSYSSLASKLIEFGRIINETGIIQRIQISNHAIQKANIKLKAQGKETKTYKDLVIALNASYKGNVSDERENANQYLIALLLHETQYLKNASMPEVKELIDFHCKNYQRPREIRVFDPLVDPDIFMGGELKARAESCMQVLSTLALDPPLELETIEACAVSYGSDIKQWRILNKRLAKLNNETKIEINNRLSTMEADLKYLELYLKGFATDPQKAYQGVDLIQLNADHDDLKNFLGNLVDVREVMKINNPNSLLVLVDNPQQAKKPFLDFDSSMEWLALGGTVASHMISSEVYSRWNKEIEKQSTWAKLFMQKVIMENSLSKEELINNGDYSKLNKEVKEEFDQLKTYADLRRDLLLQKFEEAQEMAANHKVLDRYSESIYCLSRVSTYQDAQEIDFNDWIILGGRWILNGKTKAEIDYIVNIFEQSDKLKSLGKSGYRILELFVSAQERPNILREERLLDNAGSTKEADLLVSSAADSLEYRASLSKETKNTSIRLKEFESYDERVKNISNPDELEKTWDSLFHDYLSSLKQEKDESELNKIFARMLKICSIYSQRFTYFMGTNDFDLKTIISDFCKQRDPEQVSLIEIFGDHRRHGGIFREIASGISAKNDELTDSSTELDRLAKFSEIIINSYLIHLTIAIKDENEMINKLGIFFDQYLNVHEEDYPPYVFHSLCSGASFGFNQTYYLEPNLRAKMFKLACKTGINSYKLLHHLISKKTVLAQSSQEYRDALIGDYENGIIPICYQHETICIEERLWDCMRSLRNFIRNYHDKHPLPIILKNKDASVEKLFRYKIDPSTELCWIAGISNPGKHSWDLNCVFRSPLLRQVNTDNYLNISCFTPFLTNEGKIKQIYTAFEISVIEEQNLEYLAPFADGKYEVNEEGFVHALVLLNAESKDLPSPNITMAAHTHPQYLNHQIRDLGVPEVWSMLNMQQMYAKTELAAILAEIDLSGLAQIEFYLKEFDNKEDLAKALDERLLKKSVDHIDFWILKASRDSGGRGISSRMNLNSDREDIIDFIFQKTRSDDLVMQEFVPNNAKAFINTEFAEKVEDAFIDSGINVERVTPFEQIYFAMRSFQSISGIKGYLFSANIGAVTVNAGQGAKMFYGEPIYIMPIYIAGKIQKLLDEYGDSLLKSAIPAHAEKFAQKNDIEIKENLIGSNNCFMLNGLFDYIPYLYAKRLDKNKKEKEFKIHCVENVLSGLDYFYSYYGKKILLASGSSHAESLAALEKLLKDSANQEHQGKESVIDIGLAVIELNSGLGQANLLQKAIEDMVPENKNIFLEWTEDLAAVGIASSSKKHR